MAKRKRSNKRFPSFFKKSSLGTLIIVMFAALLELGYSLHEEPSSTKLPATNQPVELYANQLDDDLKHLYIQAIGSAQKSVTLVIYSLLDPQIIKALHMKCNEGVPVHIVCDANASVGISRKLPIKTIVKRIGQGLTHQKILIIDNKQILLGSANLTHDSLKVHGNLVVGIDNIALADAITKKIMSMDDEGNFTPLLHLETEAGPENVELWQLPDDPQAVTRMMQLIRSAKKTIKVAMFTWTRRDFTEALIEAKKRGVKVETVIDRYSGKGASAKIVKMLEESGIPVRFNSGKGLLHYKFAYIDNEILVNGSANWTNAAFTVNDDYFIVVSPLTQDQQIKMNQLWNTIWQQTRKDLN